MLTLWSLIYWALYLCLVGVLARDIQRTGLRAPSRAVAGCSAALAGWLLVLVLVTADGTWGSHVVVWLYPGVCWRVATVWVRPGYVRDIGHKAVFITGCDSGFGHALARRLDSLGVRVFAGCYQPGGEGERRLVAACSERLRTVAVDVADHVSVNKAAAFVRDHLTPGEGLWCIVNNAGQVCCGELELLPMEDIQRLMNINCFGQVRVTKAFLPLLRAAKGRVVNVSSVVGKVSMYNLGGYCMSKFAVEAFSDCLRQEMMKWGVDVSVVEPGPYDTGMDEADPTPYYQRLWAANSEEVQSAYGRPFLDAYRQVASFAVDTNITPVIDALEDAIFSSRPLRSYATGSGSTLMPLLKVVWPSLIDRSEYLLRKFTVYPGATPEALRK